MIQQRSGNNLHFQLHIKILELHGLRWTNIGLNLMRRIIKNLKNHLNIV